MHISDSDIRLFVYDQLAPDRLHEVEQHLSECEDCATRVADLLIGGASEGGAYPARFERRRHVRIGVEQPGKIHLLSGPVQSQTEGTVTEISQGGLRVRLAQFLAPGTLLQVRTTDAIYMGEVRHCQPFDEQHVAGVRVFAVTRINYI